MDESTAATTSQWYRDYYAKLGSDRNNIIRNKGVLFQKLAYDTSIFRAFRIACAGQIGDLKVLDVGCGDGRDLANFIYAGFRSNQLTGIDIQEDRIRQASQLLPGCEFILGDASNSRLQDNAFDIVFESTMFVQLTDERLARDIAQQMLRVTKPGGFLMLADWRYSKPGNPNYRGMTRKRISGLFDVGTRTTEIAKLPGALVPPIGRFLSDHASGLYFAIRSIFPFLVGQEVTLLRKRQ